MTDLQKIALWFTICLALAIYVKLSGLAPIKIGSSSTNSVLGAQSQSPTFGSFPAH